MKKTLLLGDFTADDTDDADDSLYDFFSNVRHKVS